MKAGKLRTLWIMLRTGYYSLILFSKTIIQGYLGNMTRERADRYMQQWSKQLLQTIQLTYEVFNPHQVKFEKDKRYIVMVNHASHYDIPISLLSLHCSLRMIAKKELFRIPLFGKAMQFGEHISIDRKNRRQAVKDLQRAKEKMETGLVIWIAPEGTRSITGELGPFKRGGFVTAIKAKAMIVPVTIHGSAKVLPPKTWQFHVKQHVEVHIGQPVDASQYALDEKEALIEKVRTEIEGVKYQPES